MIKEDKQLLLQDLCGRLPYKVYINERGTPRKLVNICWNGIEFIVNSSPFGTGHGHIGTPLFNNNICYVKPYLRPLSSMTEEEKNEYLNTFKKSIIGTDEEDGRVWTVDSIDWLNKKMFDYRGLIPKELALEALDGMYN